MKPSSVYKTVLKNWRVNAGTSSRKEYTKQWRSAQSVFLNTSSHKDLQRIKVMVHYYNEKNSMNDTRKYRNNNKLTCRSKSRVNSGLMKLNYMSSMLIIVV